MKQAVIELVDVILKKIQEEPHKPLNESGLRTWLKGKGYRKRDIDAAMKLLQPRIDSIAQTHVPRALAFRTLTSHEMFKLSTEARDALFRLEKFGLVDPYEREMILDRLNHFEGEIGMEELDYLLSWVVCSSRDVESQQTIYAVLDGTKDTYH